MLKNKEKELSLTEPEEKDRYPLIIAEIAQGVSDCLELETEMGSFMNDEDDLLVDLLLMLYKGGNYREAVLLLRLAFTVTGNDSAVALLSIIRDGNGGKVEESFMKEFMVRSQRCIFRDAITRPMEEKLREEQ